ncbi:hypothetical protein AX17_006062 [Amanita inopinata Kibby_2008]|nr:hypothetical protein AX17_006062 [Amanita inopinata Kibby_2008]
MSNVTLSSSSPASGSALDTLVSPSTLVTSKPDVELPSSCQVSPATLGPQSDMALTNSQSPSCIASVTQPAPAPRVNTASLHLGSSSVVAETSKISIPQTAFASTSASFTYQLELSPLCIPAVSVTPSSPPTTSSQSTLVQSPSSQSSHVEDPELGISPSIVDAAPGNHNDAVEIEEGELEDSESSDVEIYLSSLSLENTATCTHTSTSSCAISFLMTDALLTRPFCFITVADSQRLLVEPPVLPSSSLQQQIPLKVANTDTEHPSPQMPPAPVQQTIPLPDVASECDLQSAPSQPAPPHFQCSSNPIAVSRDIQPNIGGGNDISQIPVETQDKHNNNYIDLDNSHKTPNVYINGLPPHFPEEQLYALAAPYGPIRSVRTFTRHVKESESGYGFVLFETVDAAERCILSLRRYRNLHPTFSKQVHKIPGIVYSQPPPQPFQDPECVAASPDTWGQNGSQDSELSFKEKMESLHDPTSTNLYMEGLPLSIDEPTLAALVSPHRISSSRFFQTRLSNPPRIIAFVRLETRAGAEEVIERLHGRMVRGWNDTGSRISVRFADTNEQRELRRTERANKDGEQSPARLTIAQAALLNMRGQEFRQRTNPMMSTHQSLPGLDRLARLRDQVLYPDFSSNAHASPAGFTVDYPVVQNSNYISPRLHTPLPNPYPRHINAQQFDPVASNVDPAMLTLLDSLRSSRSFPNGEYTGRDGDVHFNIRPQISNRASHVLEDLGYATQQYPVRNGYTATEEYIMRAHAESAAQRRRPPPLDLYRRRRDSDSNASIAMGVRGYRAQASTITIPQQKVFTPSVAIEPPIVTEDEFRASAAVANNDLRCCSQHQEVRKDNVVRHNHNIHPPHVNARLSREPAQARSVNAPASPNIQQQLQNTEFYPQGHMRSSTLPHRSTSTNQHQRHYQHSSMSVPNTNSIMRSQDAIATVIGSITQNTSTAGSKNKSNYNEVTIDHAPNERQEAGQTKNVSQLSYDTIKTQLEKHNTQTLRDSSTTSNLYEVDQSSSSLTSPALTYSSHTPSTLSPATPFFGSFASQSEGFEQSATHGTDAKKLKGSQ